MRKEREKERDHSYMLRRGKIPEHEKLSRIKSIFTQKKLIKVSTTEKFIH